MKVHILHEGETEAKLLSVLCAEGKLKKFNPFQHDIRKLTRLINKKDTVYIIYDTDVMGAAEIKRFKENISGILLVTSKLVLVQQNKNMEDEIEFACKGFNFKRICEAFNAKPPSVDNFKKKFIASGCCLKILQELNFDRELLFGSKSIHPDISGFDKYLGKPKYRD